MLTEESWFPVLLSLDVTCVLNLGTHSHHCLVHFGQVFNSVKVDFFADIGNFALWA